MVQVNVCIKRNWKVYRFPAEDNILQTVRIALQLKRHTMWYQVWYVQFTKEKKDHTEAGKRHVIHHTKRRLGKVPTKKQKENYYFLS